MFVSILILILIAAVACAFLYILVAGTIVYVGEYRFTKAAEQAAKDAVLAKAKAVEHAKWLADYEAVTQQRAQHKNVIDRFCTAIAMFPVTLDIITGREDQLTEDDLVVKAQFEWNMAHPLTI